MERQAVGGEAWNGPDAGRMVLARMTNSIERFRRYARFVRAGREIERLLRLSDGQLAARGMTRETVAHAVLARHGLGPEA